MRILLNILLLFISIHLFSQEGNTLKNSNVVITPEILAGITAEANSFFPERNFHKAFLVNVGWEQDNNPQEWAQRLKGPRTGLSLGYSNYGNKDSLGYSVSLMPFIEFKAFRKENLKILISSGVTYFNKIYHPITNPNNQAVSTDLTWSFRIFMNYHLFSTNKIDWRVGGGYFHHSNGHTRLPNQGYNSFLFGLSADIKYSPHSINEEIPFSTPMFSKSRYDYVSFRSGFGINVLSKVHTDKKKVYTIAGEYGRVLNNTFKLGVGFYYRFYQTYYDYIADNESLVQDGREFDYFKENPWHNATNFGLTLNSEVLLNHIGIKLSIGFNIHKPAYAIDWRINQGWSVVPREIPEESNIVLGEFNSKYQIKHLISARMGLKYYLIGTKKAPRNNVFIGVHINSNLGQADFTEFSLGYVYNFKFKN
jgi:hypothetical protein